MIQRRDPSMIFRNREQAAMLLSRRLAPYRGSHPLVLGIPRGAVPMARRIADALDGELDVVLARKLGAPDNPELAIGSIDEDGNIYLNDYGRYAFGDSDYLQEEKERQFTLIQERRRRYTPFRSPRPVEDRIVIVVDDGIATGSTIIAALRSLRLQGPKKLIAAMAVAPPETAVKLEAYADEVVCLETPQTFYAVSQFFHDFPEVSDEEVIQALNNRPSKEMQPSL